LLAEKEQTRPHISVGLLEKRWLLLLLCQLKEAFSKLTGSGQLTPLKIP
jgi:hypothetical protein